MKKIPTLFVREFGTNRVITLLHQVTPGYEWVLSGEGDATIKWDGAACAIIDGNFYKRYDAKHGKPVPDGAIRCQEEADPVTGHFPCWVQCKRNKPSDRWLWAAYDNCEEKMDGTYEAVGPHFRTNPYRLHFDHLVPHGKDVVAVERSYEGIRDFLKRNYIEGLVFWKDGIPQCKIRRKDFRIPWGKLENKTNDGLEILEVEVDENLLKAAESVLMRCGYTVEEAVVLFLKACVRFGRIPFDIPEDQLKAAQVERGG